MDYPTIEDCIGGTALVRLQRLAPPGVTVLAKLEGDNPAGSVKDRPALAMIAAAERRGEIRPGDALVEATSGNTGIALAMAAAVRGYRMILIMPENMSLERRQTMAAFGAELILVSEAEGMEGARDRALAMHAAGEARVLNQFDNPDNSAAHYRGTGPELWRQTGGELTHFVSSMGTTGTVSGAGRYLKEQAPPPEVIGVQPAEGDAIPGIRRWPEGYVPGILERDAIDREIDVSRADAEAVMRELARREGIFAGISSGGCMHAALQVAREAGAGATVAAIVCDRGDRYLSSGVYAA